MAAAGAPPLVISDANSRATDPPGGLATAATLFGGLSFFLVQRLPARGVMVRDIELNGGRVVKLEREADYVIADHARHDAPVGSYSWTLITTAIARGAMPTDPSEFPAGPRPGTVREVGSGMPVKATRTAFTREDDRELWNWVEREKARGGMVKGNELYKRLEKVNPRHTHQAWRDRYIKKLIHKPPAGVEIPPVEEDNLDMLDDFPVPPAKRRRIETASDEQGQVETDSGEGPSRNDNGVGQGSVEMAEAEQEQEDASGLDQVDDREQYEIDVQNLLDQAQHIEEIADDRVDEAWQAWSDAFPHRDSIQWSRFFVEEVLPIYRAQCESQQVHEQLNEEALEDAHATRKRKRELDIEVNEDSLDQSYQPEAPLLAAVDKSDHAPVTVDVADGSQPLKPSVAGRGDEEEIQRDVVLAELPTSDANRAADKQIQGEVLDAVGRPPDPELTGRGLDEDIQSQYEGEISFNVPVDTAEETTHVRSRGSSTSAKDGPQRSFSLRSTSSPPSSIRAEPTRSVGTALTEANLAHQEAQNRAPLVRGVDLPEDEPAKDQSDLVRFLQDTLAGKTAMDATGTTKPAFLPDADDSMSAEDDFSADDIDAVLRANADWPSSPQQPRRARPSFVASGSAKDRQPAPAEVDDKPAGPQVEDTGGPTADLHNDRHHDVESEDEIELEVALPDIGGGFDKSSDHFNSQIISDGSPELGSYTASPHQPETKDIGAAPADLYNNQHHDGESEDEIDLEVALPDVGGGFDQSSDHFNSQIISDGSPELGDYIASPRQRQSSHKPAPAQDIIEISSHYSSSIASPASSDDPPDHERTGSARPQTLLETQDIYNAATQYPDLHVPLPPDSDDWAEEGGEEDALYEPEQPREEEDLYAPEQRRADENLYEPEQPRESIVHETTTVRESTETTPDATGPYDDGTLLDSWIATMQVRGYEEQFIVEALKCTSMNPDLAELVLVHIKSGKGIPADVPGVWSDREDAQLESGRSTAVRALEAKHGWEACKARLEYLEGYKESE